MLRDQKDILMNYLVENKYLNIKTIPNSSDFVFLSKIHFVYVLTCLCNSGLSVNLIKIVFRRGEVRS